ncbi:radical SAM protein [Kibdelosporangium persicum]|uniref:Anaerobic sulfatase-maturating enzyme n=1 Tax=Kibdelosporangium persicum TaxID=2698649 RepID=A0ABX2FGS4_9PSEU|nr:radical SAM protein [Kibdelosporangium persicum]NRN70021.1 Anaerobic sulfatase-maturating enzyme [Kibdelosporangium persicum]
MQWVIKITKRCNLRCKYCYEWDFLSDPARMSLDVWRSTLHAILEYSELAEAQSGIPTYSSLIWHGGEPLLLPPAYFESVLELQREVFPAEWIKQGRFRNCIQTNLFSVTDAQLDLLQRHEFKVGVSLDFVGDVRVTANGRPTEERVKQNLGRLRARGIPYQLITVLARHTASEVEGVFREIHNLNVPTRLLPLFEGPPSRDLRNVELSRSAMLDAMLRMFELWFDAGMSPKMRPFDHAVETIVMKKLGLLRSPQDRTKLNHEVLVVDRDGSVSCASHRDSWRVGNVTHMTVSDIVRSDSYRALVSDESDLKRSICGPCPFFGPCDTSPIASCFDSFIFRDCVIEKPLYTAIEAYLDERGLLGTEFLGSAQAQVADYVRAEMQLDAPAGRGDLSLNSGRRGPC